MFQIETDIDSYDVDSKWRLFQDGVHLGTVSRTLIKYCAKLMKFGVKTAFIIWNKTQIKTCWFHLIWRHVKMAVIFHTLKHYLVSFLQFLSIICQILQSDASNTEVWNFMGTRVICIQLALKSRWRLTLRCRYCRPYWNFRHLDEVVIQFVSIYGCYIIFNTYIKFRWTTSALRQIFHIW